MFAPSDSGDQRPNSIDLPNSQVPMGEISFVEMGQGLLSRGATGRERTPSSAEFPCPYSGDPAPAGRRFRPATRGAARRIPKSRPDLARGGSAGGVLSVPLDIFESTPDGRWPAPGDRMPPKIWAGAGCLTGLPASWAISAEVGPPRYADLNRPTLGSHRYRKEGGMKWLEAIQSASSIPILEFWDGDESPID